MPIPPDNRAPGDDGHVEDHNAISDVLTVLSGAQPSGTAAAGKVPVATGTGSAAAWKATSEVITAYGPLATTQPDDVLPVVDVHDTTMAPSGTTKKIAVSALLATAMAPAFAASSRSLPLYIVPPPSGDATGSTDTSNIAAVESAAATAGGMVVFAPGTYITTGLTKQSNTMWQGAGEMVTTIKLAAAADTDVVQGANFGTLTGTGSQAGITAWSIRDLTIDGNRSAQTGASYGLRVYGYAFKLINVTITNCFSDGLYTEWAYAGSFSYGTRTDSLEALFQGVKCCWNGGWGWHNRGPHDSIAVGCVWFGNNQAGGTAGNLWCEDDYTSQHYLASGLQCSGCHAWGFNAAWNIISDSLLIWTGGEIEGGTYGAILVRGGLEMSATKVYYFAPSPLTPGAGIQLGDDGATPGVPSSFSFTSSRVRISAAGLSNFAGAGRSSAALAWVACNTSEVQVSCSAPSVTVAFASNGQAVNALAGSQLFVSSTSGWPGTGTLYVATSSGYAQCTYTSITAGGAPSFNGVTYVTGPGPSNSTVATGGVVVGDPLGGTTPDIYSTVRLDQGTGGNSGVRGALSVQQVPGHVTAVIGDGLATSWHIQGPTSNDLVNINWSTHASPKWQFVGTKVEGWTAGYGTITQSVNPATGGIQPGTTAGAGATIYSGTGAPNVSGSVAGDMYFRTDTPTTVNQRIYVATGDNTWTGIL